MNKYIAEFIGTFFLVLTIGCTGIPANPGVIAPLAIGAVLMVMVYAGAHVSGSHYNPAVTLAVTLRGRISAAVAVGYIVAQLLAAAAAAGTVYYMLGKFGGAHRLTAFGPAFLAEGLFTFALAYVAQLSTT